MRGRERERELRSGESGHGSPPGVGRRRRRGGSSVIGERGLGERGTREGRVDLRGEGEETLASRRGISENKRGH